MNTYAHFPPAARRIAIVVGAFLVVAIGIAIWRWPAGMLRPEKRPQTGLSATYAGEANCASCHTGETKDWTGSHHALAMQQATDATVLGNFDDAQFTRDGVASSFSKKNGKFHVRTDGPDGKLQDYELPYTFGVFPLQQYLAPFPGGRLQSLGIAWDSREKEHGGQRWFHLYPNQAMPYNDPLHWTGRNQTWNYMCAECHSTDLRKNYNLATDGYSTTWSEINVSCESCHGPGSKHVEWALSHKGGPEKKEYGDSGLTADLKTHGDGGWLMKPGDATMHWNGEVRSHNEIETCAPCHSRRRPITSEYVPGQRFLDAYVPSLLAEGVYYADGQIQEEDYEYGSFVQSKMYHEGVTCSDCHDPHSGKLKQASFNATCGQCHALSTFDTAEHHRHKPGSTEAQCVSCHMPTHTYMVVDVRRDHSFRVPRPDLSLQFGAPNACTQCHTDKPARWAADAVAKWYGPKRRLEPQFVDAIDAGRRGRVDAENLLASLAMDSSKPAIARATALTLLPEYLSPASLPAVQSSLADSEALVRSAAVQALGAIAPPERIPMATPLLVDPIRSVRIEAARVLAGTPPNLLQESQKAALEQATSELIASEMASAERPENHVNLAALYLQLGRTTDAESELQTALRLDPKFIPAMVNLADLYRSLHRDDEGQQWLEKAIALEPNAAEPIHALGLLKVREKQYQEALNLLAKAAALQPANVSYSYVYAVALQSSGQVKQAIRVLEQAHRQRPADREVLAALISYEREKGDVRSAVAYARQLIQLSPSDPQAKALLAELLKQKG
jgi:tetratricopeptide (TPR) repeat protein